MPEPTAKIYSLPTRKPGQVFVSIMIFLTIIWVMLYITLHILASSSGTLAKFAHIDMKETYRLTPQGEFIILDTQSINWVMGETNSTPILKRLDERTGKIRNLMDNVRIDAERLEKSLVRESKANLSGPNSPITIINDALSYSYCKQKQPCQQKSTCSTNCGVWDSAYKSIQKLSGELASLSNFAETNEILNRLTRSLSELQQQTNEQFNDATALKSSKARSFFWTSPGGSSAEVIFFAVFGVLANLLVNSAEYLRKGNFKQSERWVAYTKLIYGPILAWILVTAIAVGWFDLGEYKVGTYSLPLLAFILGFYSRKTVALFDKLGKKVLGEAEKSIEKGPAEITARRRAYLEQFLHSLKPRDLKEIKRSAFDIKDEIIKTIVLEKEARK